MFLTLGCVQGIGETQFSPAIVDNTDWIFLVWSSYILVHRDRREYYRNGFRFSLWSFWRTLGCACGFLITGYDGKKLLESLLELLVFLLIVAKLQGTGGEGARRPCIPHRIQTLRSIELLILIANTLSLVLEKFSDPSSSPISRGPLSRRVSPWSNGRIPNDRFSSKCSNRISPHLQNRIVQREKMSSVQAMKRIAAKTPQLLLYQCVYPSPFSELRMTIFKTHTAANQPHKHDPSYQFLLYATLLSFDLQYAAFSRLIQRSLFNYIPSFNLPSSFISKYPYWHYPRVCLWFILQMTGCHQITHIPKFRAIQLAPAKSLSISNMDYACLQRRRAQVAILSISANLSFVASWILEVISLEPLRKSHFPCQLTLRFRGAFYWRCRYFLRRNSSAGISIINFIFRRLDEPWSIPPLHQSQLCL